MIKAAWGVGPYVNVADSEDVDGFTMVAAGKTGIVTIDENGYGGSGNAGGWTAHSGTSATFSLAANNLEWDDGIQWEGLQIYTYNPTISLTGGGTQSEDDDTPIDFVFSRDLPTNRSSLHDDAIPDTNVNVTRGGSATHGTDYTDTLSSSIIALAGTSNYAFSATPLIDDEIDEGSESLVYEISANANQGQVNPLYSQATVALADSNKFRLAKNQLKTFYSGDGTTSATVKFMFEEGAGDVEIIRKDQNGVLFTEIITVTALQPLTVSGKLVSIKITAGAAGLQGALVD